MRLRYLNLPDYGVLRDLRILFRQETILERAGSLQFVVGLNGSGKSSLLRAIYEAFRWLEDELTPPFPISIVYEFGEGDKRVIAIFRHMTSTPSEARFAVIPSGSPLFNEADSLSHENAWDALLERLEDEEIRASCEVIDGDKLKGNQFLSRHLPSPLLAYSSGNIAAWKKVRERELSGEDLSLLLDDVNNTEQDRPRGWNAGRELAEADSPIDESQRRKLREGFAPSDREADARCLFLEPLDMKLSAIAVGLDVAARELREYSTELEQKAWRETLRENVAQQQHGKRPDEKNARTLLNEIDWLMPTHLSITYQPVQARVNPEWHAQRLALAALADEIISQPLGRMQMVIELGSGTRTIEPDIHGVYGDKEVPAEVKEVIDRVEGSVSGAEAVVRVLSTSKVGKGENDRRLWEVFRTLRAWRVSGMIEDATVTVKRVTPMQAHDGEPDDVVLLWDDFSDGEQMLLGRMAMLLLLRAQADSLLLLDEPETHFNDSWKKEIIDIVDDNLLKTTVAQVMVATHTSIALTDAFADEIVRLVREDGHSRLKRVSFPTFGTEPGRVMLHVFDMVASIGSRAEQALREKLATEWNGNNIDELERIVANIGGGWPRAKLQQILDELTNASPGS